MNIFEKRPLSLILCIMLGGFSLFSYFNGLASVIAIACAAILFPVTYIFKFKFPINLNLCRVCLVAFSVAVILSQIFIFTFFPTRFYGKEATITGTVITSDHTGEYDSRITVDVDTVNEERVNYKMIVRGSKETLSGINSGDEVELYVAINDFENSSSFNTKSYYNSLGFSAEAELIEKGIIISSDKLIPSVVLSRFRDILSNRFKLLTDNETGGLLSALILGDRSGLDANTRINFDRTGTTHILALSGMHLVIISTAIFKILSLCRLNKKIATIATLVLSFVYVALSGFSASVTRAEVMLLISGILFLLSETKDSITTLSLSIFFIIMFQPFAIYDLSLWLSVFATLGVIVYGEIWGNAKNNERVIVKLGKNLIGAILASVFAIGATFFICLLNFDDFSVMGTLATVILSPVFTFLIYAGILLLIFGNIIPFGGIITDISDLIKYLMDIISSAKWAKASFDSVAVKVLIILLTVYLFCFLIFKFKHKRIAIIIYLCLFIAVNVAGYLDTKQARYTDDVIYITDKSADAFVLKSDGESSIIYSGGYRSRSLYGICNYVTENKISYVDNIVLTHYESTTTDISDILLSEFRCGTLYVPIPMNKYEEQIARDLAYKLAFYSAKIKFYGKEDPVALGDYRYTMISRESYNSTDFTAQNVFLLSFDGEILTYISGGLCEDNFHHASKIASVSHTLIVGSYGKNYSDGYNFDIRLKNLKRILLPGNIPLENNTKNYYEKLSTEITHTEYDTSLIH